jgi:Sugar phosphate permease
MEALASVGAQTLSKVKWRLLPFCLLLYIFNNVDRMNIGFAALEMNHDLNITSLAFGTLTSAFFISYLVFAVPSNLILHRIGANRWLSSIIVGWGLVTMGTFFVQELWQMLILRFLLGVFEAGFFPGMIYYFSYWFPARERASATAIFMLSAPIAMFIGAPLATLIMDNIHWFNSAGWRWLFVLEGLPAALLGIVAYFRLTSKPDKALWLSREERGWLTGELAKEAQLKTATAKMSVGQVFMERKVWLLGIIYMTFNTVGLTINFWMPSFVKEFSQVFSNSDVGLMMMLPGIFGILLMPLWGRHSDKSGERKWHTALPMMVTAAGLVMIAVSSNVIVKIVGLTLAGVGTFIYFGPFWSLPGIFLSDKAAAVGVAVINAASSLGAFFGNIAIGYIKGSAYGTVGVLFFQIALCILPFFMTISMRLRDAALLNGTGGNRGENA